MPQRWAASSGSHQHQARGMASQSCGFRRPAPFTSLPRPAVCLSTPKDDIHQPDSKPSGPVPGPWSWSRVGAACAAVLTAAALLGAPQPALSVTTEQLLFLEAWRAIDRAYVDKGFNGQAWFRVRERYLKEEKMDNRQQTYTAVRKLVATLDDPFTRFLEPTRLEALRKGTGGTVTGIGVEVSLDKTNGAKSQLVVVAPLPDGPAEKAGIKPGDVITAVDGHTTEGISLYEASDLLQGQEGTALTLTVRPAKSSAVKDVQITRQKVMVNPVMWAACKVVSPATGAPDPSKKLGYIKVSTFSSKTVAAVEDALEGLRAQGAADQIVLDLRNNGGGLFPAGVQLGRLFLERGEIVLIADSAGVRDIYSADGTAQESQAPLAVLVNKGTASASEVLAGALKDNKRATIVGSESTFGKGLIQTVVDLSDGSGLAITVARYQTPSGNDINKIGVSPDITVSPEQMPPTTPEGFCSAIAGPEAPRLFM